MDGDSVVEWLQHRDGSVTLRRTFTSRSAAQAGLNALSLVVESGFVPLPQNTLNPLVDYGAAFDSGPYAYSPEGQSYAPELPPEVEALMVAANPPDPSDVLNNGKAHEGPPE